MQVSGSKTKSFCLIFQVDRIQNDVQFLVNFNPVPLFFLKIVFTPLPPGKSNLILVIWRQKKDLAPQALWQQVMQCFQRKGKRHQFGDKSYYLVILEGNHHKFASVRGWKKKPSLDVEKFRDVLLKGTVRFTDKVNLTFISLAFISDSNYRNFLCLLAVIYLNRFLLVPLSAVNANS